MQKQRVSSNATSMRLNESATCVFSQASYSEDQLAGKWSVTAARGSRTNDRVSE